jgi:hypothetical protein
LEFNNSDEIVYFSSLKLLLEYILHILLNYRDLIFFEMNSQKFNKIYMEIASLLSEIEEKKQENNLNRYICKSCLIRLINSDKRLDLFQVIFTNYFEKNKENDINENISIEKIPEIDKIIIRRHSIENKIILNTINNYIDYQNIDINIPIYFNNEFKEHFTKSINNLVNLITSLINKSNNNVINFEFKNICKNIVDSFIFHQNFVINMIEYEKKLLNICEKNIKLKKYTEELKNEIYLGENEFINFKKIQAVFQAVIFLYTDLILS